MAAEQKKSVPISLDELAKNQYKHGDKHLSKVEVLSIAYKIAELVNGLHRQGNTNINLDPKYIQVSLDPVDISPTTEFYKGLTKLSAAPSHSQKRDALQFGNLMQKMGIDGFRDFRRHENLSAIPGLGEAVSRLDDLRNQSIARESKDIVYKTAMAQDREIRIPSEKKLMMAELHILQTKLGIKRDRNIDEFIENREAAIEQLQPLFESSIRNVQFKYWDEILNPNSRLNAYETFIDPINQNAQSVIIDFIDQCTNSLALKAELPHLSDNQIDELSKGAQILKNQVILYQSAELLQTDIENSKKSPTRDQYAVLVKRIDEFESQIKMQPNIKNVTALNDMTRALYADLKILEDIIFKQEFKSEVLNQVAKKARQVQSKPIERTPETVVEPEVEPPTLHPSQKDPQNALRERARQLQAQVSQLDQDLNKLKGKKSPEAQSLTKNRNAAARQLNALQQQLTYFSSSLSEGYHPINYEDFKKLTPVQKLEVVKGMHDIVHDAHQCGLMLNDLALERFGMSISQDGRVLVEYQGHAESIAHHQGHEATLLARADIFFLGETFKQLKLSAKLTDPMTTTDSEKRVTDQQITEKFKSLMPNQAALTAQQIENERLMSELKWQIHRYESQVGENPLLAYLNQLVVEDPNFALALFQKATEANQKDPMSKMLEEIAKIQNQESSLEQSTQTIQATISSLTQQREVYTTQLEGLEIQLQTYLQAQQQLKNIISASPEKLEKGELTFKDPLRGGSDVLIGASQDQLQKLSRSTSPNIMSHGNYIGKDYARDRLEKLNQYLKDNPTYKRYIAAAAALKKLEQQEARLRETQHSTAVQAKDDAKSLLKTWRQATIKSASDSKLSNMKKQSMKGQAQKKSDDSSKKPKRSQ